MADENLNINVKLKGDDAANKKVSKLQQGFDTLKSKARLLAIAGLGAIAIALKKSVDAFAQQEKAVVQLKAALKATGQEVDNNARQMQKFASELQKVTTVGDETSIRLMQVATNMGLNSKQAQQATKDAIGLSKAYGVDTQAAIKAVTAAQLGDYNMLNRYIPSLRTVTDETEKATLAKKLLAASFDVAKAETQTFSGAMQQLQNSTGDLMEEIGGLLAPAIVWLAKKLKGAVEGMQGFSDKMRMAARAGDALKIVMLGFQQTALGAIKNVLTQFNKFLSLLNKIPGIDINVDAAIESIDKLDERMQQQKVDIAQRNLEEIEGERAKEEEKKIIHEEYDQISLDQQNVKKELLEGERAQELAAFQAFENEKLITKLKADQALTKAELKRIKDYTLARKQASVEYVGYVAAAAEEEKDIGRAVAVGTLEFIKDGLKKQILAQAAALVETGFALLLSSLGTNPQGYAHVAAGGVLAAGGVQAVNSIQLAEGGIVQPQRGGVTATVAEAGQAEAVIPLDRLGELLGAAPVNVYISGKPLAKDMYETQQEMMRTGELEA